MSDILFSFQCKKKKMSDTSHKHCKFTQEPIGEKPVTALAGIGKVLASRLADNRINKVSTCVDFFLIFDFFFQSKQ